MACAPSTPSPSTRTIRCRAWWSASGPTRSHRRAGRGSRCKAASLNHHDLWTLRGVGIKAEQLPMILGCDAAGIDESTGDEVVVHAVINQPGWTGDDTVDPKRSPAVGEAPGFAGRIRDRAEAQRGAEARGPVVRRVGMPVDRLADRLPDAVHQVGAAAGPDRCWCRAPSGGVATACISMARAAGLRVYATARTEDKQARALELGAHEAFASGARLPERVDAVMETVGEATYAHSARSLKPGGRIVISGATSGPTRRPTSTGSSSCSWNSSARRWAPRPSCSDLIAFLRRHRAAPADRPHAAAGAGRRRARRDGVRRPRRQDRARALSGATSSTPRRRRSTARR